MVTRNSVNTYIVPTADNEVTAPAQPAFSAYNNTARSNVTGAGVLYSIIFEQESFDIGSNYNATTGIFTAPVTGKYLFMASVAVDQLAAANVRIEILYNYSGGLKVPYQSNGGSLRDSGNSLIVNTNSSIISMASGSTIGIQVRVTGGTQIIDIPAGIDTIFSGFLIG